MPVEDVLIDGVAKLGLGGSFVLGPVARQDCHRNRQIPSLVPHFTASSAITYSN